MFVNFMLISVPGGFTGEIRTLEPVLYNVDINLNKCDTERRELSLTGKLGHICKHFSQICTYSVNCTTSTLLGPLP